MSRRGNGRLLQLAGVVALGVTTWTVAPADAAPAPRPTTSCVGADAPDNAQARSTSPTRYRRDVGADVSAAEAAAVRRTIGHRARRDVPSTIVVPVRAHVLKGTHARDRHTTRRQVILQIRHLNQAYAGGEAPGLAADTKVRFRLRSITATVNDRWFHLDGPGAEANRMKRSLHQGKSFTLNLYFVDLSSKGLLGYTTFPWRYHVHPQLDGVVVAYNTVPTGTLKPYDEGDTAVHEVGHWLGLLHTFQGGCEGAGDGVADTPAEAEPQFECDETADTCESPGLDPVHNFMDYSLDSCMNQFTPGQAARMRSAWGAFRQRR